MSMNTVAEFAAELKKSPETLLEQLKAAGVVKASSQDALTEPDKQKLLAYLQASHGTAERKKITLVKKSTSEIKQADATGRARTIQVEVRKKRTLIKRDEADTDVPGAVEQDAAPSQEDQELVRREEEARRQAESIRRQEEELVEQRREREERERREREAEERAAAYAAQEAQKKAQANAAREEAQQQAVAEASARAAAQAEARAKAEAESQARAAEESARAKDLDERRRKALAEAEAIRAMMAAPKKVLVAKKPVEEPKPAAAPAADAKKGTLHKPATGSAGARAGAPAAAPSGA